MNNTLDENQLTPAGQRRRNAMLDGLMDDMRSVHRVRRARRCATAVSLAAVCCFAVIAVATRTTTTPTTPTTSGPIATDTPDPTPSMTRDARIVRTNPSIMERYAVRNHRLTSITVEHLSDEALLDALAAMGRPAGIIRMEGKTTLSADVTDDAFPRDNKLNMLPTTNDRMPTQRLQRPIDA
ncbi:MAG: hypothetical protein KAS72_05280 [Phycisphaerales bacterium]|nr:hypothetical protein [Phycisphaerales bacterium]